jgi:hypothetical protein
MAGFFSHVLGGHTTYVSSDGNSLTNTRHITVHFGEDPQTAIRQFWLEHPEGDYLIVPDIAYGAAPRPELCTKRSLQDALREADITPGSATEQQWRKCCEALGVKWPKHLEAA